MKKEKIRKYNFETKEVELYDSITAAAASVPSNQDLWKVQMLIAYAIGTGKKAFKCGWSKIIEK